MIIKLNEIKGRMADRGRRVTLDDIAESTGINRATLDKLIAGEYSSIRLDYIDALCAYFGVTAGELIQAEPVTLPLSLNIRPDRHGAKVGERTKGKAPEPDHEIDAVIERLKEKAPAPEPVEVTTPTSLHPPGLAPLTAANLRKPLASLIDPGAVAVDTIRMEKLEARRRTLLEQAAKGRV